jgi:hypothetical protein
MITEREAIQLLRKYKDAPEFGGDFTVEKRDRIWKRFCDQMGWDADEIRKSPAYTLRDYAQYVFWGFRHVSLQPLAAGVSIFAIIFGGWITTVNASFDSVPGDVLYPVKLATERVQLTFAANAGRRARLHSEFAGRRLQEAASISSSNKQGKDVRTKAAFADFKTQVASAQAELKHVPASEMVGVAVTLDQKTDEFKSYLSQAEGSVSESVRQDVKEAQQVAEQSGEEAVQVLVKAHEETGNGGSTEALQQTFKNRLQDVTKRSALVLGRLLTTEMVVGKMKQEESQERLLGKIRATRFDVQVQAGEVADAMDRFAAGGYRTAFDTLEKISDVLDGAEDVVAEIEITVSTTPVE